MLCPRGSDGIVHYETVICTSGGRTCELLHVLIFNHTSAESETGLLLHLGIRVDITLTCTHRLDVETSPSTGTGDREEGERVPLRHADCRAVDLDVCPYFELVAPAQEN